VACSRASGKKPSSSHSPAAPSASRGRPGGEDRGQQGLRLGRVQHIRQSAVRRLAYERSVITSLQAGNLAFPDSEYYPHRLWNSWVIPATTAVASTQPKAINTQV
jgi:hypothetical protein